MGNKSNVCYLVRSYAGTTAVFVCEKLVDAKVAAVSKAKEIHSVPDDASKFQLRESLYSPIGRCWDVVRVAHSTQCAVMSITPVEFFRRWCGPTD